MDTAEHSAPGRVPGIGSKTLIAFAALVAVVFVVVAALPYRAMLGPQDAAQQALEGFQFQYWPRRGWLLTHITCGLIALLTGPVQLWLGLHNVKMNVHRRLGLVYLAAVAIGSVAAFGLALKTDGGAIFGSGLFFLGVAWLTTTGMAFVAIRKYLIDQHREWMIRSYVVTFAFVTFRAGQVALVGRGVDLPTAISIMAWACWAIPLLATELILQARKIAAVHA